MPKSNPLCICCPIRVVMLATLVTPLCPAQQIQPDVSHAGVRHQQSTTLHLDTLLQRSSSWDDTPYPAYLGGTPQVSVLRITIAPHSTLRWHTHPMLNAAYVASGEITVEKKDGTSKHFKAGEVIAELVDSVHRGLTGDNSAVLIVFYAGAAGTPLSQTEN